MLANHLAPLRPGLFFRLRYVLSLPSQGHTRRQFIALLFGAGACSLVACAPSAMGPVTVFVDPGKYDTSPAINSSICTRWAEREMELKVLMDKAEQSASGVVVNFMAHQADHAMAYEELKVIDAAWKVKNAHAPAWRMPA
jgi:hypothetical protein